jgi:rubrerythrin
MPATDACKDSSGKFDEIVSYVSTFAKPSHGDGAMFDIGDIVEIAVQLEANSERTYRQAARRALKQQVAKLLNRLAEEEGKHGAWFVQFRQRGGARKKVNAPLEKMGRDLMKNVLKDQTFSLNDTDLSIIDRQADVLRIALEFENDTILFYEMIGSFLETENVLSELDRIIGEERNHIRFLKGLLATLAKGDSVLI